MIDKHRYLKYLKVLKSLEFKKNPSFKRFSKDKKTNQYFITKVVDKPKKK